ncbi:adipokinetic hormone-like [Stomoxys calcitrans]|uniref:adipokinetic hormone-like n=1 Tax=Stomoxys calcitrans TaxID=35570 RepID=UPI0027E3193A|nr:adipokinetic hormone-like [Stomoxys calcitrans]
MNSLRAVVLQSALLGLLLIATCVQCQLTFSPDWGKRSGESMNGARFKTQIGNCKRASDILLEIFKFVQHQSEMFTDCKYGK